MLKVSNRKTKKKYLILPILDPFFQVFSVKINEILKGKIYTAVFMTNSKIQILEVILRS